jgi:Ca2+-dependent lipid-binding protein
MFLQEAMGKGSFLFGVMLGSTATAALFFYYFSSSAGGDDEKKKRNFQLRQKRRSSSQARSVLGRVNPETSFFTDILAELWCHIKIAAADKVQSKVEPYFKAMPAPMNTCRFVKVDLGDVPMKMDNIVVHPIQNDAVQWDFDMEWDGECDIQLQADFIGTFGIKKLKLFGRLAVIFKPLTNELPVVSGIQYAFINMPLVDLKFTGLASVAEMSVLNDSIKAAIQGSLLSSCLPYRRLYKLSADNNYLDTYVPPLGVLRLTVETGRGFVIEKRLLAKDDIPDVYLNISLGAASPGEVWRTKTIMDDCNPKWNVTQDFLLWDRTQEITVHAWDEDGGPLDPDDDLGVASISVMELLLSPHRRKEMPVFQNGRETGAFVTISCSICDWTADVSSLSSANGVLENDSKTRKASKTTEMSGLLVIIINRAFDLPVDRVTAATFVKTKFGGKEYDSNVIYDYPRYYDALNPVYDSAFTIPLSNDMKLEDDTAIEMELIDAGQDDASNVVGRTTVTLGQLKEYPDNTLTDKRKLSEDGNNGAALEFRVSLSGVTVSDHQPETMGELMDPHGGLAPGSSSPTKALPTQRLTGPLHDSINEDDVIGALGTLRVTVLSGRGLKIEHQLFEVAIPDCYCIVSIGSRNFRTSVKHNTIKPKWEESKEFPLDDHGDLVKLEVWDMNEEVAGNGIILGDATTTVGKLLMSGRSTELEIQKNGRSSGIFISLKCDMVA